jgi:hypothetical protein
MTEREIEALEKQLKAVELPPLSDAFFARVAKQLADDREEAEPPLEADLEDLADVEAALSRLRPRAPSNAFFEKVAAALAEDDKQNEVVFEKPPARGRFIRFPSWLAATATAASAACALAVGLHFASSDAPFPNYELISTEKQLCNVEELPIEMRDDGTLIRPVRYIYTNMKRWRDPRTKSSFVEYLPFEETVPTVVAVY